MVEAVLQWWPADDEEESGGSVRELVEDARLGVEQAWEELYRRYYTRLIGVARHRLGHDLASEAVAETMVRAMTGIENFRWRGGGFDAWIFRILHNVIVDQWRRDGRMTKRIAPDAPPARGPEEAMIDHEEAGAVRRAFARLSPEDQELLELRVIAQLSAEQVGQVLGKRAGSVRMAQARALKRLRSLLEEAS